MNDLSVYAQTAAPPTHGFCLPQQQFGEDVDHSQMLLQQLNGSCHPYQVSGSIPLTINNNYSADLAFHHPQDSASNQQLLGLQASDQFQQQHLQMGQFVHGQESSEQQFQVDRLVIGADQVQQGQPQNAADAVAAATFLLAANCYDGVLLQPSSGQQHQTHTMVQTQQMVGIGLENVPTTGYSIGFYGQSVGVDGSVNQFPPSTTSETCPTTTQQSSFHQTQPLAPVDNLLMQEPTQLNNNNNNVNEFDCVQSQPQGPQIVQDPQQALNHHQQVSPEKVDAAIVNGPQQCATCREQIHDRFMLSVSQLYYHVGCLRCASCATQLDTEPTCFWKLQAAYCKQCYMQKFQTKCASCDRHIQPTDWVRRARNYVYHLACFSCQHCKRQLSTGEQFSLQEQRLLCKQHYLELVQGEDAQQKSKTKRIRTTFAEEQLSILQAHFQMDCNPDGADLERIANQTGLSKRVTQVWFQNSRARQKKYQVGGKKSGMSTDHHSDTAPLGSSNSGRSSPTTTVDSSMSPMTKSPPSVERHTMMTSSEHHLLTSGHPMDGTSTMDYVGNIAL
ncbi:LIM/homeobox protein Awh [Aphelenchoides bicaudatus]|nr:LIM/homeobox protein Awh [Aphelenchoides bicaudatus]